MSSLNDDGKGIVESDASGDALGAVREPRRATTFMLVSLATLLALAVRLFRLDTPILWLDELTSLLFTTEPWHRLFGDLRDIDIHPPTYYIVQKAWIELVGNSTFQARLLPALLGTACIPLVFVLGRRLIGTRGAIIAAFLLTTAPLQVHYSRELRMYSMLCVVVLVALIGLVYALPRQTAADRVPVAQGDWPRLAWTTYVLGCVLAFYVHNSALLLPVLAMVWVAGCWLGCRVSARWVGGCALASIVVALACLPWIPIMMTLHATSAVSQANSWIPFPPTWSWTRSQLLGTYPYPPWLKVVFFALAAGGLFVLARVRLASAGFVITFVVGQPLLMWVLTLFRPVFLVRGLVWPTMLFAMLPAMLLTRLPLRLATLATAMLVALQVTALKNDYPATIQRTDSAGLTVTLAAFDLSADVLVLGHSFFEAALRREVPQLFDGRVLAISDGTNFHLGALHKASPTRLADVAGAIGNARRVWLIDEIVVPSFGKAPPRDASAPLNLIGNMGHIVGTWTSGNLKLTVVERR